MAFQLEASAAKVLYDLAVVVASSQDYKKVACLSVQFTPGLTSISVYQFVEHMLSSMLLFGLQYIDSILCSNMVDRCSNLAVLGSFSKSSPDYLPHPYLL